MKNLIKIHLVLGLLCLCISAEACKLSIPESYVPTFLNPPVSGHYKKCEEATKEKCVCVENVDPWATDLIDGELVPNSDKKFAREHSEKVARDNEKLKEESRKAAKDRVKVLDLSKTLTTKQLTDALKDIQEILK